MKTMFRRIYLDNSATTQPDPRVVDAMLPYLKEMFGNASSIHHFGQEARAAVDKARHQVAALINSRPSEIVFTSGGTESNNLAIKGLLESNEKYGRHIVTSAIEHSAVKNLCQDLEKRGADVTYIPVAENGIVSVGDVASAIRDDTVLVTLMMANNEIGTLQPVNDVGAVVRRLREKGRKIWFHTDAVQAVGKVPVDVEEIGCDLLSLSGHKIHAPKGIGALYIRRGTRLHPQNMGGRQERGFRGGTEAVPNIAALGKAAEIAADELSTATNDLMQLRDRFESEVGEKISGVQFNGDRSLRIPNISNISFRSVQGEGLLINLDMKGIAVSTGSACSSGSIEPSPVILALGCDEEEARSAVRFSFGRFNTAEDVEQLMTILPQAVNDLRKIAATS